MGLWPQANNRLRFQRQDLLFLLLKPGGPVFHPDSGPSRHAAGIQGLNGLATVRYTIQNVVGAEGRETPVGSEILLL